MRIYLTLLISVISSIIIFSLWLIVAFKFTPTGYRFVRDQGFFEIGPDPGTYPFTTGLLIGGLAGVVFGLALGIRLYLSVPRYQYDPMVAGLVIGEIFLLAGFILLEFLQHGWFLAIGLQRDFGGFLRMNALFLVPSITSGPFVNMLLSLWQGDP